MPPKSKYHHRLQMYLGHFELFLLDALKEHTGLIWVESVRAALPLFARGRLDIDWEQAAKAYRRDIDDPDYLRAFDESVAQLADLVDAGDYDSDMEINPSLKVDSRRLRSKDV